MEHIRPPNASLCHGWYCTLCGEPCGMFGHKCSKPPNPELVAQLAKLNAAPRFESI